MKDAKIGDYLLWDGELAVVVDETKTRAIVIEIVEEVKCEHCNMLTGKKRRLSIEPTSQQFQEYATPVQTIQNIQHSDINVGD